MLPRLNNHTNQMKPMDVGITNLDHLCTDDQKRYYANQTVFSAKLPDPFQIGFGMTVLTGRYFSLGMSKIIWLTTALFWYTCTLIYTFLHKAVERSKKCQFHSVPC